MLKNTPTLLVWGDFITQNPRWPTIRKNVEDFMAKVSSAGGRVDALDLPA